MFSSTCKQIIESCILQNSLATVKILIEDKIYCTDKSCHREVETLIEPWRQSSSNIFANSSSSKRYRLRFKCRRDSPSYDPSRYTKSCLNLHKKTTQPLTNKGFRQGNLYLARAELNASKYNILTKSFQLHGYSNYIVIPTGRLQASFTKITISTEKMGAGWMMRRASIWTLSEMKT